MITQPSSSLRLANCVPSASTYYASGKGTCGGAALLKTTLDGTTFVLTKPGSARDIYGTYATPLPGRPPRKPADARIYFESDNC